MYEDSIGIIIGYKEVFDKPELSKKAIIELLNEFDVFSASMLFSKFLLALESDENKNGSHIFQFALMREMLLPAERDRIISFFNDNPRNKRFALLHSQVLMGLIKLNLDHNQPGGKNIETFDEQNLMAKIIFGFNGIWQQPKYTTPYGREGTQKGLKETVRTGHAKQFLIEGDETLMNLMVRGDYYIKKIIERKQFDIVSLFKKATGLDIYHYLDVIFMLAMQWSITPDIKEIEKNTFKDINTYFQNTKLTQDEIEKIVEIVSFEYEGYKNLARDNFKRIDMTDNRLDNFITLITKPIHKRDNLLLCLSPSFLSMQFTDGPYNILREYIKENGGGQALPNEYSAVYEEYIKSKLQPAFKSLFKPNVKTDSGIESIDGVIELEDHVLLIEIKSPHWSFKARAAANKDSMRKYILEFSRYKEHRERLGQKKTNKKRGFGQIKYFYEQYKNGDFSSSMDFGKKKIIPIVILNESYPFDPLNRELMMNHLEAQECLIKAPEVLPPVVLNTSEVELISAMVESKGLKLFEAIISAYANELYAKRLSPYFERPTTFKNIVLANKLSFNNDKDLRKQFDLITKRIESLMVKPDD